MLARSRDPRWCDARKVAEMIELTLDMAERAARAAREKAGALGTPITVTVVDEAGRLVLCARRVGPRLRSSLVILRSVDKSARHWRGSRRLFSPSGTGAAARWSRQCTR